MQSKGQISLEYLLVIFIMIIILTVITIPLVIDSLEKTNDITTVLKVKDSMVEVANAIKIVSSSPFGTKKTISVNIPMDMKIFYNSVSDRNYIKSNIKLSDGYSKAVTVEVPCKVTFNGNSNNYYASLHERWYYNTSVQWIYANDGSSSINVNFK